VPEPTPSPIGSGSSFAGSVVAGSIGAAIRIDPRGPRFAATVTTVVLALSLLLGSGPILLLQAVIFAIGADFGVQASPYGLIYKKLVRPRLAPPTETEDARPPRFAQTVGLVVAVAGLVGWAFGSSIALAVATAMALVAAFLNAAFGLCLGCELYLILLRLTRRSV
jgi:Ca2+/Na+ antiporter